jgi:predicted permease
MLVGCAGLLVRSFISLRTIDPGFRTENRQTFDIALPDVQYNSAAKRALFFSEFLARVRSMPGVKSAAATTGVPMGSFVYGMSVTSIDGRTLTPTQQDQLSSQIRRVSDGYFNVLGIPIRAGRGITSEDRFGREPVVVLNESAARRLVPGGDAIGHTVAIGTTFEHEPGLPVGHGKVVGIVGDVRQFGLTNPPAPEMYFAIDQYPPDFGTVAVQSSLQPAVLTAGVTRILREIAPDVAAFHVTTMDALEGASIGRPRFLMGLLAIFAGVAVAMAIIGLYGVIAFGVGERTKEIGIRVALGAQQHAVARMVIADGLVLGALGVVGGLAISGAAVRGLQSVLYGIKPLDPLTFAITGAVMLGATLLATWLPARRAARLDPVTAIRFE